MTGQFGIPIEEAARKLGTTVVAVLMHIKQKRLQASEVGGTWYVNAEDLETLGTEGVGVVPHLCRGGCSGNHGCSSKG